MEALHGVPPLLQHCAAQWVDCARDEYGGVRSSLKPLRMVCKYTSEAVLSELKGFCLNLSHQPTNTTRAAELLRKARLQRLRVVINVETGETALHIVELSVAFTVVIN